MALQCTHLDTIQHVRPSAQGCEDCLRAGDTWVHLRICLACGYVGCCDDSPNTHARDHFHGDGHPVIQTFEPHENWLWCYADELLMQPRQPAD
ncbi:MAG TPA: UBP-type zinc finger domain-containing protein [Euzebyales bacterium]|nr:UBP-type zinc finger domain-containing protein [Euzebyales bacterium]